ncbi:N-acetyltransferase [Clostridium polyendosporum]|uniref:N-acetyltransferase n=1 Tax=Clostridium polyendosporum TaxID=69208 RepID=A0A919S0I8_9CLOT|nr:GNAT family N-acetyltransferase [Clostridium polyendosporum]GIM29634.1 N-acetyltransferase [Clostridium polyendosporum]
MPLFARFKLNNIESIFNDFPELETEGFKLRKLKKDDAKDIWDIYQNKDIATYDRAPFIRDEESAKDFIEELSELYEERIRIDWAIEDKRISKVIGLIVLFNISLVDSRAEVGYVLNRDFTNRGIMKYILSWLVDFSFNYAGIHKLEANINTGNISSIKVCESAGFEKEGTRKAHCFNKRTGIYMDNYVYGLINNRWDIIIERFE